MILLDALLILTLPDKYNRTAQLWRVDTSCQDLYIDLMEPNAQKVITILEELRQKLGPAHVAFWALPNTVLTLSGARAYCDGVFWDNDKQNLLETCDREIVEAVAVIKAKFPVVTTETGIEVVRKTEKYASYELILDEGLKYVLGQTHLYEVADLERLKLQHTAAELIGVMQDLLRVKLPNRL